MEILFRIANTFENVRTAIKNKNSSERLEVLKRDIQTLDNDVVILGKENQDQYVRSIAMQSYLALLSTKTMPMTLIEKKNILSSTFEKLKNFALTDECLFIFMRVQNLLCYYLIQLDQINQAREILENMEDLYDKINKYQPDGILDAEDLFTADANHHNKKLNPEKIDKVITNNLQMQAFLYNKINLQEKYTLYNHTVLRRQLEMKDGTPQDWALRTARLGNYFTYLHQIDRARHHLCAAYYVLRTCYDNCKLVPEEFALQKADFEMHFLELSHHWFKYGLTLFKISKKKILNRYFSRPTSRTDLWKTVDTAEESEFDQYDEDDEKMTNLRSENSGKGDIPPEYTFPSLDLKEIEEKVPSRPVRSVKEARQLFAFSHKWLMRSKHYYDFEQYPTQYISCTLQLAELYEHLVFFERNIDTQYTIQKRRADVLETLNSLLKTCDNVISVQIDVIRELSQVQLELMTLNLQKLWREESQTNVFNMVTDANSLIYSLESVSSKTLTEKTLNTSSKNIFLRKMEAATSINGQLFRLREQLVPELPSQISVNSDMRDF